MTSESAQFLVCRSTKWYHQHHFGILVLVQTILAKNEVTAGSSHHSLNKVTWYLVAYLTHYQVKIQKMIYILPPSSAHERTTNNDIRSSYSTPLPLQSISFITSWSNSQSRTQKKLKKFHLPGTTTELTRVCPYLIPQNQTNGKECGPVTVQNNSHMYMRIYERTYVCTYVRAR